MRIGTGFDAHKFGDMKVTSITVGGVAVPYHREVLAHSDGDVILHALCDAMLGALALGDIGHHFPDTDKQYLDADSRELLRATNQLILGKQYKVLNADITLIAEAPRVAKYIEAMRANIAQDLAIEIGQVSVKATTTEKMGFVGREEGFAAQAVVLLGE
jgi:2-C-methyl-D-erythritol 2,4-cyclodiphosphate synthase